MYFCLFSNLSGISMRNCYANRTIVYTKSLFIQVKGEFENNRTDNKGLFSRSVLPIEFIVIP